MLCIHGSSLLKVKLCVSNVSFSLVCITLQVSQLRGIEECRVYLGPLCVYLRMQTPQSTG